MIEAKLVIDLLLNAVQLAVNLGHNVLELLRRDTLLFQQLLELLRRDTLLFQQLFHPPRDALRQSKQKHSTARHTHSSTAQRPALTKLTPTTKFLHRGQRSIWCRTLPWLLMSFAFIHFCQYVEERRVLVLPEKTKWEPGWIQQLHIDDRFGTLLQGLDNLVLFDLLV